MITLVFICIALAILCKQQQKLIECKLMRDYKHKLVRRHGLLDIAFVMLTLAVLILVFITIKDK